MIKTSIVIQFGEGAEGLAIVEFNQESLGDKTTFQPGDIIPFLVHLAPELSIESVKATSGGVTATGVILQEREQALLFIEQTDTQQLKYIPNGVMLQKWYGNEGTGVHRVSNTVTVGGGDFHCTCTNTNNVLFKTYNYQAPSV